MNSQYNQLDMFVKTSEEDYTFLDVCNNLHSYSQSEATNKLYTYFKKKGFPYYEISEVEKKIHINKLINFNHMTLLEDDNINQSMHCLRLAWSYFPHSWSVQCGKSKYTPMDIFNKEDLFKKTLKKTYDYCIKHEGGKMSLNRIRQSLKVYNGVQSVSNFRPTAAKIIYELFSGDGVVWDMSSGCGGRLLGALSSCKVKKYIGTEPSTKTYHGLLKIKEDFLYLKKEVELHKRGSEVFKPDKNSLDLCFTSPPYFDTEKYSNELTQSYIKYSSEKDWIDGFLTKTIENCYHGLKKNSYMVLNIAKTNNAKNIEKDLIKISKKIGFKFIKILKLCLSSISGNGVKYEPIYIFKKEKNGTSK